MLVKGAVGFVLALEDWLSASLVRIRRNSSYRVSVFMFYLFYSTVISLALQHKRLGCKFSRPILERYISYSFYCSCFNYSGLRVHWS